MKPDFVQKCSHPRTSPNLVAGHNTNKRRSDPSASTSSNPRSNHFARTSEGSHGLASSIFHLAKDLMIRADMWRKKMEAMKDRERTRTMKGSTRRPGESSVYNRSMVFEDPPAPAARDELGLATCEAAARRRTCPAPGGLETAPGRPAGLVGRLTSESDMF